MFLPSFYLWPYSTLISDGTFLYGMTNGGGTNGMGIIFRIKPDGTEFMKLWDFDGFISGASPLGSLISDGNFLYGTTYTGGTKGYGTIFRIKPDGTEFMKLWDFDNTSNGTYKNGDIVTDGTYLYGMTSQGGVHNLGTIYKLKLDGSEYLQLFDFDRYTSGAYPLSTLITDSLFLYGTAAIGGSDDQGTIFKYCLRPTFSTDTITSCGNFSWNGYTYTVSGTYMDTITNMEGCDSIMTLHLIINNPTSDSLLITSCKSMMSPSGKYLLDSSGYYLDTIPNSKGCDSLLTIQFIRTSLNDSILVKNCDSILSPSGKYFYYSSGIYSDTLLSSQGCDSIITSTVVIKPLHLEITKSNAISCDTPYCKLNASGGDFYQWEPSEGLSNAHIADPIATPNITRTYYVTATNDIGCSKRDSIVVVVEKKDSIELIPNIFTPNNDGYNDCFELSAFTEFKEIELIVFNRWGNMVFRSNDPKVCWDGRELSGKNVSAGVYFFILSGKDYCNQKVNRQGTITVVR